MCCLVKAIVHLRGQWQTSKEQWRKNDLEGWNWRNSKYNLLQHNAVHHESHVTSARSSPASLTKCGTLLNGHLVSQNPFQKWQKFDSPVASQLHRMCRAVSSCHNNFHSKVLTLTLVVAERGTYPKVASASLFSWIHSRPRSSLKCVLRCRRNNVLLGGMESKLASSSAVKRGSWTIRPPWTPAQKAIALVSSWGRRSKGRVFTFYGGKHHTERTRISWQTKIWGSHGGNYEHYHLLHYDVM